MRIQYFRGEAEEALWEYFLFKQQHKETIFHVLVFLIKQQVRICAEKNIHSQKKQEPLRLNTFQFF